MNAVAPPTPAIADRDGRTELGGEGRVPVLELEAVTKTYGSEPPVVSLDGVSFSVHQGELLAIVGPSGSGKSTLLHVMGTLDRPSAGTVRVTGLDVAGLSDRELAAVRATRIGFVFQQFFLAEHATALENVADGLLYAGVPVAERRLAAAEVLAAVGLGDRLKARPNQLSGGERQRVAIARALVGRPAIVLADEPTGNLDSATGIAILALLEQLHDDGATIAVITHDRDLARRLPRQVEMLDGRIVGDTATSAEHGRTTSSAAGADATAEPAVTDGTEADGHGRKERS
jgi:putative ABC transport system ATP-binding protein